MPPQDIQATATPRAPRRKRRVIGTVLLALLVLLAGTVGFLTATPPGLAMLAGIASSLASSADRTVRITGLSGLWAGPLSVEAVMVEDADGPWLALRGVEADVSYTALLAGTLKADRVAARRIEVARAPLPGETPTESGPFELPLDIEISQIALPEIALGEALVGEVATLSLTGKAVAVAEPLKIEAELDATRTDGRQGDLSARVVFAPAENRIDLTAEGAEPAGGVIANLLRLPGAPPVSLAFEGSGPAADWRGQGAIAVDEQVVVRLSGRHQTTDRGSRVELTGDGEFARFLPETIRSVAEGATAIDIAATLVTGGGIEIERASLESAALSATARGSIAPEGSSDFRLDLASRGDGPLVLAFGEGEGRTVVALTRAEATVSGDGGRPVVDAAATLARIETAGYVLRDVGLDLSSSGFDVATQTGQVEVQLSAGAVAGGPEAVARLLDGAFAASGRMTIGADSVAVEQFALTGAQLGATAAGTVARNGATMALDVTADIAAAALPGTEPLGERVTVAGRVTRAANGALDISGLTLESGPLAAAGTAALADGAVTAKLDGTFADLSRLAGEVAGAAGFALTVEGPLVGPKITARITSDRIESGGHAITALTLDAEATADAGLPQADVRISGRVGEETLDGRATLSSEGGRSTVDALRLSLGDNRIEGDLVLDEAFRPKGEVAFTLPDLGPLAALAAERVTGSATGRIVFPGGSDVRLDATIPAFTRDTLSARDVRVTADVTDYLTNPTVAGRVQAAGLNAGDTAISGIDVRLTRDGEWTGFDGGATVSGIPATAAGRVRVADGTVRIELDEGGATVSGVAASIAGRSVVTIADGTTRLDGLRLGVAGGTATIDGTAGERLDLTARLSGIPASVANGFVPGLGAAGTASGTVRVTGTGAAPVVNFDVNLAGAAVAQTREAGFGAMQISSTGTFQNGTLNFRANVGEGGGLTLNGGGTVATTGARALDLNFAGRVPFSFLSRRLAAQGLSLTGTADVRVSVGGTIAQPAIGGAITANGARFVDAGTGIAINDIAADIGLGDGRATLRSLTGTISSGGRVTASGTVGIDPAAGFPADLTVSVTDGRYTDGRVVTANFGGDLKVTGPLGGQPLLSGTVNLGRTVITVPERLPAGLSRLNVQHRDPSAAVAAQAEALRPATTAGGGGGLTLDVTVNAPQQLFVQGRGLDAEMGGSIRLVGPVSNPQATGLFELRRGRLGLLDRRLDFSRGNVGFSGSLVPSLDFAATSTISGTTVTVTVTGAATNPQFGFSSSPAAPQDEVLALLVFGRSLSNLSPLQIAQLASAAAQLAGIGGSTSLLDSLQSKLGVDDIDVRTDQETGDTSVSVGKYLNDRTYITIEKGSQPGSGKAAIDLEVGRGVKLRGEAADDGSTKGGIFFEREY